MLKTQVATNTPLLCGFRIPISKRMALQTTGKIHIEVHFKVHLFLVICLNKNSFLATNEIADYPDTIGEYYFCVTIPKMLIPSEISGKTLELEYPIVRYTIGDSKNQISEKDELINK